ncbi:hypothetical protein ABIB25_003485 [Nakamurella sp. UYEF19]|uniref:ATP-grasp domain-containing protein n=1 Tax=Nakamurella sp. UYEF19 TaxID=1756392 RepID=UPI00339B63CB
MSPDPEFTRLALYARSDDVRAGLRWAAERVGLTVVDLTADPSSVAAAVGPGTAVRAPGGLVSSAMAGSAVTADGAVITLAGPTPEWFASLGPAVTGRQWVLCTPTEARSMVQDSPTFVKLADGKHPGFPARRLRSAEVLDEAVAAVGGSPDVELLVTKEWLAIDSEYRIFTVTREVTAASPYRVQDEPWSPLLRTHRASFHDEAAEWAHQFLSGLDADSVPPAAVLDIARLDDGRFVLLEVNQTWGAGLYGCDPAGALRAVLAANSAGAPGPDGRWLWRPDRHLRY